MGENSVVLSYHDSLLRNSDVQLLDDGYWLNDNIIGFIFEFYEYEKYEKYSEDLLFVNPSMVQLLKFSGENDVISLIECWNWQKRKLIFIPLNDNSSSTNSGGSHWSLLVINTGKSMCYSFDSSQNFNLESAQEFCKLINKAITSSGYKKLKFVQKPTPQQSNSSDCGVYVVCLVEEICDRHIKNYNKNDETQPSVADMKFDLQPHNATQQRKNIKDLIRRLSEKN